MMRRSDVERVRGIVAVRVGAGARGAYRKRDPGHYAIQSLDRAIDVLEAFRSGEPERGVAELARELGLPRATVHRLLAALASRGFLAQDERTGKYRLGLKLFELGSLVADSLDVRRVAHPHLVELMKETGETTHLVVLEGANIVFVDKVETDNPFRMVSVIGGRLPARFSGSGKALLAELPKDDVARRLEHLPPDALADLHARLVEIRERGWAMDDEETQPGLRCVGAVVRDHTGGAIAGLSVSGPLVRMGDDRVPALVRLLRAKADAISRGLGCPSP
jgi:DNA-binding IclR family transcriptional regulator